MADILYKEESYQLIGRCMEVHKLLGPGFKEAVYKDALEIEFQDHCITYRREQLYRIEYKNRILRHRYIADFVVHNSIILEAKAASAIIGQFTAQTMNYLKASGLRLGIIVNFGEPLLTFRRVVF